MDEDSYIKLYMPNENTGEEEEMYVSISVLFSRMWDEYIRGMMSDEYMGGMLMDLGLNNAEVVHMMGRLKAGKDEYEAGDYREMAYL